MTIVIYDNTSDSGRLRSQNLWSR